jgi:glutamate 5-kinase
MLRRTKVVPRVNLVLVVSQGGGFFVDFFSESYKRIEEEQLTSRRLVVKIGTQTFCEANGIVHESFVSSLAEQILYLREQGIQTTVVCSGAVALGRLRVPDIFDKRLAASLGQPLLMQAWNRTFYPIPALQFLFSDKDLENERGIKEMVLTGMTYGIPIINGSGNENNDSHASKLARIIGADSLVLLTNKHGVLDQQDRTVPLVRGMEDISHLIKDEHSIGGSGGMRVKASAAVSFATTGGQAFIAHGHQPGILKALVDGQYQGVTRFA